MHAGSPNGGGFFSVMELCAGEAPFGLGSDEGHAFAVGNGEGLADGVEIALQVHEI